MSAAHDLARRLWARELGAAGTVLDLALAPAEAAFRLGVAIRDRRFRSGGREVVRAGVPVVSVGNVAVGGTGKTPFSHWVALRLREGGRRPALLHGGYAADEPELHRRWTPDLPVVVGRDRAEGAARAVADGADVLVLDDGFQHRRLHRDLDIVLVSAERWERRPRLLPRGPWREPPEAMSRAGVVVVTRKTASPEEARRVADEVATVAGRAAVLVHLRPSGWRHAGGGVADRPAEPVLLVSGIAEPELFRRNAEEAGARVAEVMAFPDHHEYSAADVARIRRAAGERPVVTTEKDWTRLESGLAGTDVRLLAQEVVIEAGAGRLAAALEAVLA